MKKNILIIGKPNVGKSTILNLIINNNISTVDKKKNTTDRCLKIIYKNSKEKKNIIDTPGIEILNKKINQNIIKIIYKNINKHNLFILVIDSNILNSEDFFLLNLIKKKKYKILIFNKIDKFKNVSDIENLMHKIKNRYNFNKTFILSNINVTLINILKLYLFENKIFNEVCYDKKLIIKDIAKKSLLENTDNEIPYTTKIYVNLKQKKHILINYLLKNINQKKIIIGVKGQKIKNIINSIKNELIKRKIKYNKIIIDITY